MTPPGPGVAGAPQLLEGVVVLDTLDADAVRRWSRAAIDRLTAHRSEIDALNVFPVADSDTGGNMLITLRAAGDALDAALRTGPPPGAALALAAMADGAARGAVGNSGFIVSQIVRGLAFAAAETDSCDAAALAAGLDAGAHLARQAVMTPVHGTILTVARVAADAAVAAHAGGASLAGVVAGAVTAADAALQRTPGQLAELGAHGVVDAGGRGFVVLLEALSRTISGSAVELTPVTAPARGHGAMRETGSSEFGFEVQYLIDAPAPAVDALRGRLGELGDSVAVVGITGDTWKVHAHVNDVGAAIEAGVEAGRAHQIAVVRFAEGADPSDSSDTPSTAVLAVAPGHGLAHLFHSEGVYVVEGSAGAPPSTDDVVAMIHAAGARSLVLLPNASLVTGVAEAAAHRARAEGLRVSVVPTRSPVQGLAAIAVHDPSRRFDDDVVAMAEAAAATRFAEITIATAEGLTAVGICQPGDVLGLIDGEVVEIGRGLLAVAFGLVDRLLAVGAELMTVLVGAPAPNRAGELIEAHVRDRAPFTDVSVYQGGQADHPVIIGVE
ncbi:MAG: DAK2 domain-containing protein [Jatrophihabitans sp.]